MLVCSKDEGPETEVEKMRYISSPAIFLVLTPMAASRRNDAMTIRHKRSSAIKLLVTVILVIASFSAASGQQAGNSELTPYIFERINQWNYISQGWVEQQINNQLGGQVFSDTSDFVDIVCGPENSSDPRLIHGSALMTLPTTANPTLQRIRLRKEGLSGTRLADLTELKYSTYVNYNSPAVLVLAIDADNDGDRDFNISYNPDQRSYLQDDPHFPPIMIGTWQQWDALHTTWLGGTGVVTGDRFSITDLVTDYPEARILDEPPIGGRGAGVYFTLGPATPAFWFMFTDAVGYVDALIIGAGEQLPSTLFDFTCSNPNE